MFFKVVWSLLIVSSIILFAVLNQHDVLLHLFFLDVKIPVAVLIVLSMLLGTILQSCSGWWHAFKQWMRRTRA